MMGLKKKLTKTKNKMKKLLPAHIRILDGNLGTVKHLQHRISPTTNTQAQAIEYYLSKERMDAAYFNRYFDFLKDMEEGENTFSI